MSSFEKRGKDFENKFIHDKEMELKVAARRNKLMGVWAAEKLGKKGDDIDIYAASLALRVLDERRKDTARRVHFDFEKAGLGIGLTEVRSQLEHFQTLAHEQIFGKK